MVCGNSSRGEQQGRQSTENITDFSTSLKEMKSTGCNLLVVGDAPKQAFTCVSANLLGDATMLRYRLLAITDTTPQSIVDRLPSPTDSPLSLPETTHVLNYTSGPRSLTGACSANAPVELAGIPETYVGDAKLEGLEEAFVDGINEFENQAGSRGLKPGELRICIDSLRPLLDRYDESEVKRFLRTVGKRVVATNAMGHYILRADYDSTVVESVATEVDAVIEIRTDGQTEQSHEIQQRWHIPERGLRMDWIPL